MCRAIISATAISSSTTTTSYTPKRLLLPPGCAALLSHAAPLWSTISFAPTEKSRQGFINDLRPPLYAAAFRVLTKYRKNEALIRNDGVYVISGIFCRANACVCGKNAFPPRPLAANRQICKRSGRFVGKPEVCQRSEGRRSMRRPLPARAAYGKTARAAALFPQTKATLPKRARITPSWPESARCSNPARPARPRLPAFPGIRCNRFPILRRQCRSAAWYRIRSPRR